jgi:FMN-dependent oxidoreductase (nitrilotriacetate monooxygenase family)
MYHLAWFIGNGFGMQAWNPNGGDGLFTGSNAREWLKPDLYIDLASSLERAGFDYVLIEDTAMIDDTFRGDAEVTLRRGFFAPKNDPMPLALLMAEHTTHIGIVPTCSTVQYPPYLAARLFTTLDHLTAGRIGINVVTSVSNQAAQNYGMDSLPSKPLRYEAANEWVDIVQQLQESWEPDAVIADVEAGVYADASKVHTIDFVGKYFKCRGPLNTVPGPQRAVPIVQAGNSPEGRDLTARFAISILATASSVEEMKALRADMHERLARFGRKPEELKILFLVSPIVAETDEVASERVAAEERYRQTDAYLEYQLWYLDHLVSGTIPFGDFDLDSPIGEALTEVPADSISVLQKMIKGREHLTLRQIAVGHGPGRNNLGLAGSPETVAARMDEIMAEVGGDGFLIYSPTTRRGIAEIADGLVPILQRRKSVRSRYENNTLKQNLLAF